jgi:hypothetical protein
MGIFLLQMDKATGASPPASRQQFDVWQFATSDKNGGQMRYF